MLKKHMVADHIHKGAEALRLAQAVLAQNREDPGKGLLAHIFDGLRGAVAGSEA